MIVALIPQVSVCQRLTCLPSPIYGKSIERQSYQVDHELGIEKQFV